MPARGAPRMLTRWRVSVAPDTRAPSRRCETGNTAAAVAPGHQATRPGGSREIVLCLAGYP
jgi:hypothetical protein